MLNYEVKNTTEHMISWETQCLCVFPALCLLFKLGVFFGIINYICLSFVWIHADIYFNYISYLELLIFCCQYVATTSYYSILLIPL